MGIVGDNGAGKSTLLKIISGAYSAISGTIELDGKPLRLKSPHVANKVGIETVYQDVALCENLSVLANLWLGRECFYPLIPKGLRFLNYIQMEHRAQTALANFGLQLPALGLPLAALSNEQRQLVAFARALVNQPKVILLDEPTAALGVAQTRQVLNLITRLKEQGMAVILSSHNLQEIFEIADRVTVLRAGRNVGLFETANARPEQVLASITGTTFGAALGAGENL